MSERFSFHAIGRIVCDAQYHYEAPRQAVFAGNGAFLRWTDRRYAAAAADLEGFDRIWLIWVFDQNKHDSWHVKARVPIPAEKDHYSVFATRSPYRPNPIGISAVELLGITADGLKLGACDLLNNTAVLDVKPYIPEADAFPAARAGWRDRIDRRTYKLQWSSIAEAQSLFIRDRGGVDLQNFCFVQLSHRPDDKSRKRLLKLPEKDLWQLHCRTWKIIFKLDTAADCVQIKYIASNYPPDELLPGADDPYLDKELHRQFNDCFEL